MKNFSTQWSGWINMLLHVGLLKKKERCPVAHCYDNIWAILAQSKIKSGQYRQW